MGRKGAESSLAPGTIHVWVWELDREAAIPALISVLCAEELVRARRYRRETDQIRFVCSRGGMRRILADYVGVAPQELRFGVGRVGKPFLVWPSVKELRFNLAHSGGLAVLVVSSLAEVGVDVEWGRKVVNTSGLAQRFFSSEEAAAISRLSGEDQQMLFLRFWTCKEAVLKGVGAGLTLGLEKVAIPWLLTASAFSLPPVCGEGDWSSSPSKVVLSTQHSAKLLGEEDGFSCGHEWWVWEWRPGAEYLAAIACSHPWERTSIRWWSGDEKLKVI